MNTGLLHLRHISYQNKTFATAIPRKSTVYVYVHKYQDILDHDPGELTYQQYFKWLSDNKYTEERTGAHSQTIKQEYDQIPHEDKTTLTGTLERQTTLFDYL